MDASLSRLRKRAIGSRHGLLVSEEVLHRACAQWLSLAKARYPTLAWMTHIPNGGKRPKGEAGKLKAMGVVPGMPDFILPVRSGPWIGLAVELKSATGKLRPSQSAWLEMLASQGWKTHVVREFEDFADVVVDYLRAIDAT